MGPASTAACPFLQREILFIKEFSSKGVGKEFVGYYTGVQANVLGEKSFHLQIFLGYIISSSQSMFAYQTCS